MTRTTTEPTSYEPIAAAVRALAAVCDGAVTYDGAGFDGSDTRFGHRLAALPVAMWPAGAAHEAWRMLRKYRAQLAGLGIDYDALPVPPAAEQADVRQAVRRALWAHENRPRVSLEADGIVIAFQYDPELVAAVRQVTGARFDRASRRWTAPPESASEAVAWGERAGAVVEEPVLRLADAPRRPVAQIVMEGEVIVARTPYDPGAVAAMKAIDGRRWDAGRRVNTFPLSSGRHVLDLAERYGYSVADEVREAIAGRERDAKELRAASAAASADIELPDDLAAKLYPFQRAGVAYAARTGRTYIADEMGLGKTRQALTTLRVRDAFPAVVVTPASLKFVWEREARTVLPGMTVEVLDGARGTYDADADITIVNYENLAKHVGRLRDRGVRAMVLDEAHYVKNPKAQRTRAVRALAGWEPAGRGWRPGPDGLVDTMLLLTGTPILNRPTELLEPLGIIGRLDEFGGWWRFATRYAGGRRGPYGMEWQTPTREALAELHDRLRATCMVRRSKADVLTELPPKLPPAVVPIPLDNEAEYRHAERDLLDFIGERAAALARADEEAARETARRVAEDPTLDPDQELERRTREARTKAIDAAARADVLVRFNVLRQLAVRGKVRGIAEWVRTFLDGTEEKLILFAHHVEAGIQPLLAELADLRPVAITGAESIAERQAAVDAFQADPDIRLAVVGIKAGGLGITLTAARHVAFAELDWVPGNLQQAEDRAHRIGQIADVQPWYLLAPGTIDEDMDAILAEKRMVAGQAIDGVDPEQIRTSILADLTARMAERARGWRDE
jgi:hypothetical protein